MESQDIDVAGTQDIEKQARNLAESKYETRWEAVKGFTQGAFPAVVTFGLGAAAVATVAVTGAAILGAFGVGAGVASLGAALSTVATVGLGTGVLAGTATGLAAANRANRQASERNQAIDIQLAKLELEAAQHGTHLPQTVLTPEPQNPAKNSDFIQNLVQQGKTTFAPGEIVKRAAQDAGVIRSR